MKTVIEYSTTALTGLLFCLACATACPLLHAQHDGGVQIDGTFVLDVDFSPDSRSLAVASNRGLDLINVESGEIINKLGSGKIYRAVEFVDDKEIVATRDGPRKLKTSKETGIWRFHDDPQAFHVFGQLPEYKTFLRPPQAFPDGRRYLSIIGKSNERHEITSSQLVTLSPMGVLNENYYKPHYSWPTCFCFLKNGRRVAIASFDSAKLERDSVLEITAPDEAQIVERIHFKNTTIAAVVANQQHLILIGAINNNDGQTQLRAWTLDTKTKQQVNVISFPTNFRGHQYNIQLETNPTSNQYAFTCNYIRKTPRMQSVIGRIMVCDFRSGKQLWHADTDEPTSECSLAYSPDGNKLAFAYEGTVKILDAANGRLIRTLRITR